ncbi:hypothetical protein GW17_00030143 [Ensete ventricosum]|nr:hypothetical protein GW17_00030143 [Ensete ventricosum]
MVEKSKILIIGGTGYIGKFIVAASARSGHPTFALVRSTTAPADQPAKAKLLHDFQAAGVTFLRGDLHDPDSLVRAIQQVDVVISAVGSQQFKDQTKIIDAIKDAGGHIKVRLFLLSSSYFGNDADRIHVVEPAKSMYAIKVQIRRSVQAAGIPYTYVSCNCFAGCFLPKLAQAEASGLPTDKVVILGEGNTKELPMPLSIRLAISHSFFVNGDQTNFEIEPSFGVEASVLYPDVKYTTVDEYLDRFL